MMVFEHHVPLRIEIEAREHRLRLIPQLRCSLVHHSRRMVSDEIPERIPAHEPVVFCKGLAVRQQTVTDPLDMRFVPRRVYFFRHGFAQDSGVILPK